MNFEQYAVLHETSPISQTPSDQLSVSYEQAENIERLADKIEEPGTRHKHAKPATKGQ